MGCQRFLRGVDEMIYLLQDLTNYCSDPGLANILDVIQKALKLFQIVMPILSIISLTVIFLKLMSNPENKKMKNAIRNWLLAFFSSDY